MRKCTLAGVLLLCAMGCWTGLMGNPVGIMIWAPKDKFVRAEPLPINVVIGNHSKEALEVRADLDPKYLRLKFRVTDPEGKTFVPEPLVVVSAVDTGKIELGPAETMTYTAVVLYGVVDGVGKFILDKTGKYAIQALYDPKGNGETISSKPITITVVEAAGADREAQRLFTGREQGELVSGAGASQVAAEKFHTILQKYPASRFAPYAAYYLGTHYRRQRDYKQSIELFERILADYKDFPLNADLRYQLSFAYNATGRKDDAKQCLIELMTREPRHVVARRAEQVLRELQSH